MSQKNKTIVGWLAFFFVCFHVAAIFIYGAPYQFGLQKGQKIVTPYISPIFEQNWSMFAPCPVVDGKVYVKIEYEDETVDWFDPRASDRKWHRWLRGSHHGDRLLLEANVIHYIWAEVEEFGLKYNEEIPDNLIEPFRETGGYVTAKRYSYGVARNYSDKQPKKIWVMAEMTNLLSGESGQFVLPEMTWW